MAITTIMIWVCTLTLNLSLKEFTVGKSFTSQAQWLHLACLLGTALRLKGAVRFQYEPNSVSNAAKTSWLCADKLVTALVNPFEGKAAKAAVSSTTFSFDTVNIGFKSLIGGPNLVAKRNGMTTLLCN
jgi:hypothetical protein